MIYWKVNVLPLSGHKYEEVFRNADIYIKLFKKRSSKKPFIKSKLYKKKIFFDFFWDHLFSKPLSQRKQRLKLFPCGLELLQNSTYQPSVKLINGEKLLRFYGQVTGNRTFVVQVKETNKSHLQLISMFWK